MRAAWLVLPAVLLGCDGAPRSPAEGSRSTEPAARIALSAPETLVGEWRLAGVDGHLVDLPHAITMSIDAERILVVSDCVNLAWSYRYERGRLTTERVAQETCARGLYSVEEAITDLFSAPANVRRTEANGIEIAGPEHRATIFSQ